MKFFDTYALVESTKGNPRYVNAMNSFFVTTTQNLMEFYYVLLRDYDEHTAEKYYAQLKRVCVPVSDEHIKAAMKLKLRERKKRNLISYVDCIGYTVALSLGYPFVTGEKHFKHLNNVEFIV